VTIHRSSGWLGFDPECDPTTDDQVEDPTIMRALKPEVVDAVWAAVEPLVPAPDRTHPLGCHRPRVADRLCFWGILIRLVTGCSWVSVEAILEFQVSDTTLRARRDEWIDAGVFDQLRRHALDAYDRIIGLDLSEVALDGSLHKAPCGGEGTGKNPTDRAKLGWKWSVAVDAHGIPVGWAIDGANRNDMKLLGPTLDDVAQFGLLEEIETLHLDRGYDYPAIRAQLTDFGLGDLNIQRRSNPGEKAPVAQPMRLGLRWVVEGTNSWLSNYGQLRRNTDRRTRHRHAQLCLVVALLITAKLIDWRNRWSPDSRPIR
jgi:transposase